jgi:hypothetical protein
MRRARRELEAAVADLRTVTEACLADFRKLGAEHAAVLDAARDFRRTLAWIADQESGIWGVKAREALDEHPGWTATT